MLPDCLQDDPRALVYITLGTVSEHAAELAAAVSGISRLHVRVLVTVGPRIGPADLGPQPPNVTVERYVSQTEVLPRVSAVVSHAGSATFLGALCHGVPQVCLPQAADQFRNAKGGVASGSALVLLPSEATPQTVADAVSRVLTDVRFRAAAKVVADEIESLPSPTEVVHALEASISGTVPRRHRR